MLHGLAEQIIENYNQYKKEILTKIEAYAYRKKRYDVDFTISIMISTSAFHTQSIQEHIRDTDLMIVLAKNLVAVVFDFTNEEMGLKASENLMALIEPQMFDKHLFVSVVSSHNSLDDDEQVRKALDLLIEDITQGFDGVPVMD
jgi:uncharacterized membrane protein